MISQPTRPTCTLSAPTRCHRGRTEDRVFFQAEDGIRDLGVTGVQTCALPICVRIANHEILLARRNIEPGEKRIHGWQLDRDQSAARRLFGEVQAEYGFLGFRLAGRVEMVLDHKIRTLRETQRETLREKLRLCAYNPAAEGQGSAARPHTAEARLRTLALFQMGASVGIGKVQDVM